MTIGPACYIRTVDAGGLAMIRAILKDGVIRPAEPLPPDWQDGQELLVDRESPAFDAQDFDRWAEDLDEGARHITPENAAALERALVEIERESKDAVRREWGLP
jgi:hypothetical protein